MLRKLLRTSAVFVCLAGFGSTLQAAKPLEIFFVDVEGGQATLIVRPSGQSMLIDTGWRFVPLELIISIGIIRGRTRWIRSGQRICARILPRWL